VAELRRVFESQSRAWSQIVTDSVDEAGPPSSAIEQLHSLTGQSSRHVHRHIYIPLGQLGHNNNNNNNNKRICIAQVCRMTSEALNGQLQ